MIIGIINFCSRFLKIDLQYFLNPVYIPYSYTMTTAKDCFVIRRQITKTLLTTNECKVLVFSKKEHATRYMGAYMQLTEQKQKIHVDHMLFDRLHRRCSLNSLQICLINEELDTSTVEPIKYDTDDFTFHLDNNLWFFQQ